MLPWILQQLYLCKEFFIHMVCLRYSENEQMDAGLTLSDVEEFCPERRETDAEDEYKFRFLCPHAGRFMCKSTDLIFEMDEKGEVLYRIEYLDKPLLDGISRTKPAGHLYNIYCREGSIRRLHLPHCQTRTAVVELTVARVTGGKVEIIKPLKVTNTHVIMDLQGLSLIGLVIGLRSQICRIKLLVLRLYEKITGKKAPPQQ